MSESVHEWATVEEHVAATLRPPPAAAVAASRQAQPSQQEEPVSSPVPAALSAIYQQAAALEADTNANPLAVILSARHVGKSFTPAECVAVADFLAALENERGQQHALAPYPEGNGHVTGPQRILQ